MKIEFMKCAGAFSQHKRHHKVFIETISHGDLHLGYIFGMNLDLVIAGVEINLGEHLGSN
jgi:hypothetical protein